jgi:hypothetical protein
MLNIVNALIAPTKDTTANWAANNPVLPDGVMATEVLPNGSKRGKMGDGTRAWNDLPYWAASYEDFEALRQELTSALTGMNWLGMLASTSLLPDATAFTGNPGDTFDIVNTDDVSGRTDIQIIGGYTVGMEALSRFMPGATAADNKWVISVDRQRAADGVTIGKRAEHWKELYEMLRTELLANSCVPTIADSAVEKPPYFHTDMMPNRRAQPFAQVGAVFPFRNI